MNDEGYQDQKKQEELINAIKAIKEKYGVDIVTKKKDITLQQSIEDVAEVVKKKTTHSTKSYTDFIDQELDKEFKRLQDKIQRTYSHERVDKMKMIKIINNFLTQYLDGYALIGIDVAGNDLVMTQYSKPSDYRAVSHLMEDYFSGELGGMRAINDLGEQYEEDDEE